MRCWRNNKEKELRRRLEYSSKVIAKRDIDLSTWYNKYGEELKRIVKDISRHMKCKGVLPTPMSRQKPGLAGEFTGRNTDSGSNLSKK